MIASPQPSSHNQLKSLNSFSASLLGDKSYGLELRRFAVFFCGCFVPTIMKADGLGPFKKSKTFLQAILCCSLPGDFISAGPDYLTVQCMGHGIKVPVEIFIDRHLFDISAHRCPVAASHSQVSLRRHISCEVDPHCFEPCETIANGQRRKFISCITLTFQCGLPAHDRQSVALTVIDDRKVAIFPVKRVRCVVG